METVETVQGLFASGPTPTPMEDLETIRFAVAPDTTTGKIVWVAFGLEIDIVLQANSLADLETEIPRTLLTHIWVRRQNPEIVDVPQGPPEHFALWGRGHFLDIHPSLERWTRGLKAGGIEDLPNPKIELRLCANA